MFPKASPTLLQESPGEGEKNHLYFYFCKVPTSKWSPRSSRDGLVVVVGPQIGCLAGPGVREHADRKVWLAKGVSAHQGDHLPAGHGKGVSEELDGGSTVANGVRVNLFFGRLVTKLCVSLGKNNWKGKYKRYTSTQSARPVWNLNGRGIVTEHEGSPKLCRQRLPEGILQKSWSRHNPSWVVSPSTTVPLQTRNVGCVFSKLNGHQGSKIPQVCPWLSRFPKNLCQMLELVRW